MNCSPLAKQVRWWSVFCGRCTLSHTGRDAKVMIIDHKPEDRSPGARTYQGFWLILYLGSSHWQDFKKLNLVQQENIMKFESTSGRCEKKMKKRFTCLRSKVRKGQVGIRTQALLGRNCCGPQLICMWSFRAEESEQGEACSSIVTYLIYIFFRQ